MRRTWEEKSGVPSWSKLMERLERETEVWNWKEGDYLSEEVDLWVISIQVAIISQ